MAPTYSKFLTQKTVISAASGLSILLWLLRTKKAKKRTRFVDNFFFLQFLVAGRAADTIGTLVFCIICLVTKN